MPAMLRSTERGVLRIAFVVGVVIGLAGIPVGADNGTPTAVAVVAGVALAVASLYGAVRVSPSWGWPLCGVCVLGSCWPSIVFLPWLAFSGFYAAFYVIGLLVTRMLRRMSTS